MYTVQGIKTKLEEITGSDAAEIVQLRNDPANNKYLYQKEIKLEEQLDWINNNRNRTDVVNFKVVNLGNEFKGTLSIYNIRDKRGEFGRYIVTNPINAIEAEYLLLKFCFENLGLLAVYCQTNTENKSVWGQHVKLGFRDKGTKEVTVGSNNNILVRAVIHEITADEYKAFDYGNIMKLIKFF
jgi:RimJ/RimL family protein N-acetyltransferase